jgi:hypothetical protein
LGGSLSHTAELVIHGTVAEANPTLVGTEVGHGDATEMGANSRAHENLRVDGIRKRCHGHLIEEGGVWESIRFLDLGKGKTTDEDELSVPRGLEDLTGRKLRDVELLIGVTDVSSSRDHLLVESSHNGLNSKHVAADNESLQHVNLGSLDFIVLVLLVPESVLIEPVVNLGLGVKGVAKVGGSGGGNPELLLIGAEDVVD